MKHFSNKNNKQIYKFTLSIFFSGVVFGSVAGASFQHFSNDIFIDVPDMAANSATDRCELISEFNNQMFSEFDKISEGQQGKYYIDVAACKNKITIK